MYKIRDSLIEESYNNSKSDRNFYLLAAVLAVIFAVLLILNTVVFACVVVNGASMNPTLQTGDVLVVNMKRECTYGDIVIIDGDNEVRDADGNFVSGKLIKRVIGMGGDTVRIEGGYVWLQKAGESEFTKLSEPYLEKEGITFYPIIDNPNNTAVYDFLIEEGEIFYLGDNRTNSSDSRKAENSKGHFGTCENSQITGVVTEWSLKTRRFLKAVNNIF